MKNAYRHVVTILTGLALIAGCSSGGGSTTPPSPRLISGGGVGDGDIKGTLYVYATDEDSRLPIAGAEIRVGASAAPSPCHVLTDSTGLAAFDATNCPSLTGPVTLTASASAYAPGTLIGVNGVNVTVPLRAHTRPPVDSATVSGTIAGWDTLPAPASGHQTLAIIGASQSPDLGDRANNLDSGTRNVPLLGGVSTTPIPANVCVRSALANDCNWRLTTRTGVQAHFAIIIDQDFHGTTDESDDTRSVIAWAIKTNLDFDAGATASGESLDMIAATDMQTMTTSYVAPPSGMDYVASYPMIDLGDAGRIPIIFPVMDLTHTSTTAPKLTGPLARAHYDLIAQAQDAMDQDAPSSLRWMRSVNTATTVALTTWLAPPTAVTVASGTYSFIGVSGATLHSAEINTATGDRLWSITIFDGSTSFTLPGLAPDPLPTGSLTLKVNALQIPGLNLRDVQFDDAKDLLTGLSSDAITFTK